MAKLDSLTKPVAPVFEHIAKVELPTVVGVQVMVAEIVLVPLAVNSGIENSVPLGFVEDLRQSVLLMQNLPRAGLDVPFPLFFVMPDNVKVVALPIVKVVGLIVNDSEIKSG